MPNDFKSNCSPYTKKDNLITGSPWIIFSLNLLKIFAKNKLVSQKNELFGQKRCFPTFLKQRTWFNTPGASKHFWHVHHTKIHRAKDRARYGLWYIYLARRSFLICSIKKWKKLAYKILFYDRKMLLTFWPAISMLKDAIHDVQLGREQNGTGTFQRERRQGAQQSRWWPQW